MNKPLLNKPNKNNGLIQIVHDFRFTALNVKDDYSFLDTASHEDKLAHMKERVKKLYDNGYSGVCLNVDYIDYLKNAESFIRVKEIVKYAKSLGLAVWIYDEQYYPSGGAGGLTLEGHPEFEAMGLSCVSKVAEVKADEGAIRIPSPLGHSELKYAFVVPVVDGKELFEERIDVSNCRDVAGGFCYNAPVGVWKVYCFFIRALYEGTQFCRGTRASRRYVNIFNKKAIGCFCDVTFKDGYEKHLGDAWKDIDTVFTDEPRAPIFVKWKDMGKRTVFPSFSIYDKPNVEIPDYPYVSWDEDIETLFKEKYGFDIKTILLDIYENTDKTRYARCCFYSLLSDMAVGAFSQQLKDVLSKSSITLTGHHLAEEGFDAHPVYFGDILEHLVLMDIPGCDNLKSEAKALRYSVACKLASSAAHITNRDKVLIEASNMKDADQNMTLKVAKAAISIMATHGVNVISSYYGENMLEEDQMKEFAEYVTKISSLFDGGKYCVDTFMYYPFEQLASICAPECEAVQSVVGFQDNKFAVTKTTDVLFQNQITFDFINKRMLMDCEVKDGYVVSPNGNKIYTLVFPNIPFVDDDLGKYLKKAFDCGVKIVFDGEEREIENLAFIPMFNLKNSCKSSDVVIESYSPEISFMHRKFEDYDLYMFMNTEDEPTSICVEIPADGSERFAVVDIDAYELTEISAENSGNKAKINIDISELTPKVLCKYKFK